MDFETRLESLHKSRSAPNFEIDAAVAIYERLVTAKSICASVLGADVPDAVVATVLAELTTEARFILLNDERLRSDIMVASPSYGLR